MRDKLAAFIGRIGNSKFVNTITKSLVALMPVLMIGSVGALFQQIPIQPYQDFIASTGLSNVFSAMVNVTTNLFALYAVVSIGYNATKGTDKDPFAGAIVSLVCFLLNVPMGLIDESTNAIPLTWLGPTGLFTAIIVGMLAPMMYSWMIDRNFTISLPDSVPPYIGKSFTSIFPGIGTALFFALVSAAVSMTPFGSLPAMIFALIGAPLTGIGSSIWAAIVIRLLIGVCWWFGIHGGAVLMAAAPVLMAADAANISAVAAGLAPENIITLHWLESVGNIGGAGCTLGLVICCLLWAKSSQLKELSKLTIAPSVFGINEPVVFGLPCMYNTTIAIPFICLPALLTFVSYLLVVAGILPVGNGVAAPVSMPVLYGFLNMGWRGAVWNVVEILITVAVYFPFFKRLDAKALEAEAASTTEAE